MAQLFKSVSATIRKFALSQPRLAIGTGGLSIVVAAQLLVAVLPGRMM